jgi:hypothetical protein
MMAVVLFYIIPEDRRVDVFAVMVDGCLECLMGGWTDALFGLAAIVVLH